MPETFDQTPQIVKDFANSSPEVNAVLNQESDQLVQLAIDIAYPETEYIGHGYESLVLGRKSDLGK